MPKRGGEAPRELDRAAARAEMPGPGAAEEPVAPGRGFTEADLLLAPVSAVREALLWRELGDVPG